MNTQDQRLNIACYIAGVRQEQCASLTHNPIHSVYQIAIAQYCLSRFETALEQLMPMLSVETAARQEIDFFLARCRQALFWAPVADDDDWDQALMACHAELTALNSKIGAIRDQYCSRELCWQWFELGQEIAKGTIDYSFERCPAEGESPSAAICVSTEIQGWSAANEDNLQRLENLLDISRDELLSETGSEESDDSCPVLATMYDQNPFWIKVNCGISSLESRLPDEKRARYGVNFDRDQWIYKQVQVPSQPVREILHELALIAPSKDWKAITSHSGLNKAASNFAKRMGLPIPQKRNPGRPKTTHK